MRTPTRSSRRAMARLTAAFARLTTFSVVPPVPYWDASHPGETMGRVTSCGPLQQNRGQREPVASALSQVIFGAHARTHARDAIVGVAAGRPRASTRTSQRGKRSLLVHELQPLLPVARLTFPVNEREQHDGIALRHEDQRVRYFRGRARRAIGSWRSWGNDAGRRAISPTFSSTMSRSRSPVPAARWLYHCRAARSSRAPRSCRRPSSVSAKHLARFVPGDKRC